MRTLRSLSRWRLAAVALGLALAAVAAACEGSSLGPSGPLPAKAELATEPATDGAGPTSPTPTPGREAFAPTGRTEVARVVRVVDGDTIVVRLGGQDRRLRYIGMNTPETKRPGSPVEWMGPQATAANAALVQGREVVLERDVSQVDQYGRLLRYVWLHDATRWTLVDLELVRLGFAEVETDPPDVKYADRFLAAQRAARAAGLGLWGPRPPSGH